MTDECCNKRCERQPDCVNIAPVVGVAYYAARCPAQRTGLVTIFLSRIHTARRATPSLAVQRRTARLGAVTPFLSVYLCMQIKWRKFRK